MEEFYRFLYAVIYFLRLFGLQFDLTVQHTVDIGMAATIFSRNGGYLAFQKVFFFLCEFWYHLILYFQLSKPNIENKFNEIGITSANFRGKAKERPLNSNTIENIISIIPDVNTDWLLTGKGEMLRRPDKLPQEPERKYLLKTDNTHELQVIPLYNLEATAGLVELFQHYDENKPIDFLSIPNLPKCDGAVFVTGDSMYPLLKSGDIVVYKQVHNIEDGIFWGEMYLVAIDVDGDEYISVKYIQKSDIGDDYIKLVSQNGHHQPRDVRKDRIRALAMVKASVRINAMK